MRQFSLIGTVALVAFVIRWALVVPGGVSAKQRALVNYQRDSPGIAVADAGALERDLSEPKK